MRYSAVLVFCFRDGEGRGGVLCNGKEVFAGKAGEKSRVVFWYLSDTLFTGKTVFTGFFTCFSI